MLGGWLLAELPCLESLDARLKDVELALKALDFVLNYTHLVSGIECRRPSGATASVVDVGPVQTDCATDSGLAEGLEKRGEDRDSAVAWTRVSSKRK